jgi:hypothetical protein
MHPPRYLFAMFAMIALSSGAASLAQGPCTLDTAHQDAVVSEAAALLPDGAIDHDKRQVTWNSVDGTTTFAYGGCVDLGSVITRATRLPKPRTQSQVFELARELAVRLWSNPAVGARSATNALLRGLHGQIDPQQQAGKTIYNVKDPLYSELYISHEFQDGEDRVILGWQAIS